MSQTSAPTAGWPAPAPPQAWENPVPKAPRPELPLRPAVWWSAGLNAIYTLGVLAFVAVVFGLIVLMIDAASAGEAGLNFAPGETVLIVVVFVAGFLASFVLGLGLTVGALLLLRMGSSFRTFPSFAQALLASLCAFVVSSILSGVVGVFAELASSTPAVFGQ